jgi:snRNA-activating protein complex subunit 3
VYKSGFFFIENTFYIDFRDPNNKDNSKVIREWAEARKFGIYKTAKMEETRIDSLSLKFGFPWVYQHQGDCEHLISFSNAR